MVRQAAGFQLAVDVLELDIVEGEDYEVEADSLYLFSSTLAAKRELSKFTLLFGMLESFFLTQDTGRMTVSVDRFQSSNLCLMVLSEITSIFCRRCSWLREVSECLMNFLFRK